MKTDTYQEITEQIIKKLEGGEVPWHKPWNSKELRPKSFNTMKDYRGINTLLLGMTGYECPYWLTFKQTKDKGGNVNKGEKGTRIVFYRWLEYADKDNPEETRKFPMLQQYVVFNLQQTTGIDFEMPKSDLRDNKKLENCENMVKNFSDRPKIQGGNKAVYFPQLDYIGIPDIGKFDTSENYYCTLFHELVHSTGHENRLNRKLLGTGDSYGKEELIAEIGAAFLCGSTGIEGKIIDNSAAYIQGWLKTLKNDPKMVILAAGAAQKAADYIQK